MVSNPMGASSTENSATSPSGDFPSPETDSLERRSMPAADSGTLNIGNVGGNDGSGGPGLIAEVTPAGAAAAAADTSAAAAAAASDKHVIYRCEPSHAQPGPY